MPLIMPYTSGACSCNFFGAIETLPLFSTMLNTTLLIVTDSEHVILSAVQPETIAVRLNGQIDDGDDDADTSEE